MAIHLLDQHTAELIAAGEVVERPASVVKELVENAIDAGASQITVEIERGGIASMRITDNGCGIERGDIELAFVRHATSKVKTADDLEAIGTLGFRGEALASIASVSHMELLTFNKQDEAASVYRVDGGTPGKIEDAARGVGTTFTVRDLFYNTPARMKFLKKDSSEATYVTETVTRLAMSHPEVGFKYLRDGKQVFHTPGDGQLRSTVYALLGAEFAKELVDIEGAEGPLEVTGLVTPPRAARASRGMQYFYINGRFVKNRTMMAALEQAYRGMTMHGKYPGGVLFLTMPPQLVDVNVHPAKTEVRFAQEQQVFQVVYRGVKNALMETSAAHSQFTFGGEPEAGEGAATTTAATTTTAAPAPPADAAQVRVYNQMVRDVAESQPTHHEELSSPVGVIAYETKARPVVFSQAPPPRRWEDSALSIEPEEPVDIAVVPAPGAVGAMPSPAPPQTPQPHQQEMPGMETAEGQVTLRLIGEVFRTYILAETGSVLCLIDKHAAHERILYEKIEEERNEAGSQQLLAPVAVQLSAAEKTALLQSEDALLAAGVELEDFGGNAVLVRGVPSDVENTDIAGLVTEIAGRLALNPKDNMNEKTEWVLHSMACRAAVKAGDNTPPQQLLRLAEDILSGKVPPFCPHGRPVVLELERKELEKQFGRLG